MQQVGHGHWAMDMFPLKKDNIEELFNHLPCFWPKDYQRGSEGKSHQNGDYLKQMRKALACRRQNITIKLL